MVVEFLKAFFVAGVPVGVVSYLLVWWALRAEYFGRVSRMKDLKKQVKLLSKERSREKKRSRKDEGAPPARKFNPVHNKWLTFGGGFYGVVALITFAIIELAEIRDFFAQFGDNVSKLAQLEIGMFIDFFIDSMMNFVIAIAWPMYWMTEITSDFWIWVLAAYTGYWLGAKLALSGLELKRFAD